MTVHLLADYTYPGWILCRTASATQAVMDWNSWPGPEPTSLETVGWCWCKCYQCDKPMLWCVVCVSAGTRQLQSTKKPTKTSSRCEWVW